MSMMKRVSEGVGRILALSITNIVACEYCRYNILSNCYFPLPTPAHRSSQRGRRDKASIEAADQEEENATILDGYRRLAGAES
jgi:hypothetical protein